MLEWFLLISFNHLRVEIPNEKFLSRVCFIFKNASNFRTISKEIRKYQIASNHCVKSVEIRSYFWSVLSCIQSGIYEPEITPYLDPFHSVEIASNILRIMANFINPYYATDLVWYPLKTSENLWFSDVFRGYQKRLVAWNGLTIFSFFTRNLVAFNKYST